MNKIFLPVCFIAMIIFSACGNPPEVDTTTTAPAFTAPTSAFNDSSTVNQTRAGAQSLPAIPEKLNSTNSTAKLNPAHGQPGHRCDIEEGAPLGSTPNTVSQTTPAVQTVSAAQPSPSKVGGNAKLNPAHGQPGHRCDISVGAPLSSAPQPAQATTPSVSQPKPAAISTTTSKTNDGTVKLNPPHGQPGHDCAVAVGQPLKG